MQAAKQSHDDGVEGHASVVTPTLHHKAVQTEVVADAGETFKALEARVQLLEDMVRSLVSIGAQHNTSSSSAAELPSHSSSQLSNRIAFLEKMEHEHSRLLVLKGKSDEEMLATFPI